MKRTGLKRRTPLRRSGRIQVSAETRARMELPPEIRTEVMRTQKICVVCFNNFSTFQHVEIHHIFYKSQIRLKKVRDQIWNLALLHDDPSLESRSGIPLLCHDLAHENKDVRRGLEDMAISELCGVIMELDWREMIEGMLGMNMYETSNAQLLRAYERSWIQAFGKN